MKTREEILEDEFVRPPQPGLRVFSVGILKLARKLELSFAVAQSQRKEPVDAERDMIAATWLLDERNDLLSIQRGAEMGRERFFAEVLPEYEFRLSPALLALAKEEIVRANVAVEHAAVIVKAKPDTKPGPPPPGNS